MKLQIFCSQGRREVWRRNYPYLAMKAECYWRSRSSDLWQSRLSESADAKLQIFGSPGRDEMRKRNFKSLEVLAEQVRKAERQIFASQDGKRKCGSRTSHIWQSRQSGSAEAELHISGSQCRTKVRTWNFRSLAVKAERKCGSGTSGLWHLRQSRSVEVEF